MQSIRTLRPTLELPTLLEQLFPPYLTDAVSKCGAKRAEEIRLHCNRLATVTCSGRNYFTDLVLGESEMNELLQKMCGGSLYAYTQTIHQGYLPLRGGIRVGICGHAAMEHRNIIGINRISGLIIRIPHPPVLSSTPIRELFHCLKGANGILIYAPPGVGKTTLLRKIATEISFGECAKRTVVVDTREELYASLSGEEYTLDVLVGYPRHLGIEIAVRSMGAEVVLCDEIGSPSDSDAILQAANCGVPIIATTHAASVEELLRRPMIQRLHHAFVFGAYLGLSRAASEFQYHITMREELS